MPNIQLQSSDGETFKVDVEIAKQSVTIKTMLEDLCMTEEETSEPVPLPNVKAATLKKVLEWATYHKDDPTLHEEAEDKKHEPINEWDSNFLKVDQGMVFDIILAAEYLDVKGLLKVAYQTVANMIKGKSPEQIRQTLNIENDLPQ